MCFRYYVTSKIQMSRPTAPTRSTIMLVSYPIVISGKAQAWFALTPAPVVHAHAHAHVLRVHASSRCMIQCTNYPMHQLKMGTPKTGYPILGGIPEQQYLKTWGQANEFPIKTGLRSGTPVPGIPPK